MVVKKGTQKAEVQLELLRWIITGVLRSFFRVTVHMVILPDILGQSDAFQARQDSCVRVRAGERGGGWRSSVVWVTADHVKVAALLLFG